MTLAITQSVNMGCKNRDGEMRRDDSIVLEKQLIVPEVSRHKM